MNFIDPRPGYETLAMFARQVREDHSADNDRLGISMEVDVSLSRMRRTFRDITPTPRDLDGMTDHHGATVFQLEWRRKGTCLAELNADFYTLLGHFAERTQFVHQTITDSGVIYDVLLGMVEPPHSHRLRFHISGNGVQHIAESTLSL